MASPPSQIGVVALDAADYRLVRDWGFENLLLDRHQALKTFTYTNPNDPHTLDIWPTVATGLHPSEHGVATASDTEWKDLRWQALSRIAEYTVPQRIRTWLGDQMLESGVTRGLTAPVIEVDHVFDHAYMWPGICPAEHFEAVQEALHGVRHGQLTENELRTLLYRYSADEFGWIASQSGLTGVHCHALDIAGHAFARREPLLKQYYGFADSLVAWIGEFVDELVILSDHGMQVAWLNDDEPGGHSFAPFIAATPGICESLPDDIRDVYEWLSRLTVEQPRVEEASSIDTPIDRLQDLGYL